MNRSLYPALLDWKNSPTRKPLMLYGARQVGKTYLLREFGRREFDNTLYLNCYANPAVKSLFDTDVDTGRLLTGLSAIAEQRIVPSKTLIVLDEVQEVPKAVGALKYFCENCPDLHIAVAGSLLGVLNMEGTSFPTGKVDILKLYPMTFLEFLEGMGEMEKAKVLCGGDWGMIDALAADFKNLLRKYYFVGGMPEAVVSFSKNGNLEEVRAIQNAILTAYQADIAKHAGRDATRCRMVFESVPSQLARENKKFVYGALRKGSRAAEFENAIQWLVDAGLIYKVHRATKPSIPLSFYKDFEAFRLFLLDVGLLGAAANAPASQILVDDNIFSEYKGAFTENYVLEQMIGIYDTSHYYFSKPNSSLEIDFLSQIGSQVIPIEVKAEENVRAKSLRQFITVDHASEKFRGLRFSMKGFAEQEWMTNVPLWGVESYIAQTRKAFR